VIIDRVLQPGALSARFQAVHELHGSALRAHYYEGLIRGPRGSSVEAADILFDYARRMGREAELDRACAATVLQAAGELPRDVRVGVNVHASTLARDAEFAMFLGETADRAGIDVERLVVEVVEHIAPTDVTAFRDALDALRAIGARIAVDDVGLGHSNFLMILECRPDYFKIDRYFVHGAHRDHYRQAVLGSVVHLARPFGARVVAEGIEDHDDLAAARAVGIDLVQGWLLGAAVPAAEAARPLTMTPEPKRSEA